MNARIRASCKGHGGVDFQVLTETDGQRWVAQDHIGKVCLVLVRAELLEKGHSYSSSMLIKHNFFIAQGLKRALSVESQDFDEMERTGIFWIDFTDCRQFFKSFFLNCKRTLLQESRIYNFLYGCYVCNHLLSVCLCLSLPHSFLLFPLFSSSLFSSSFSYSLHSSFF